MTDSEGLAYCAAGQEGILYDRASQRLLVLNACARKIWELAGEGKDVPAIAEDLCRSYAGVQLTQAAQDVRACLAELARLGIATG